MIKGITLQNFMSYENAHVPLYSGLNLICGPNGAGKSSILLAISLVLGQINTERARRLSDLVRRGQDQSRITVAFDNSQRNNVRLFPEFKTDTVNVTRIIRKSGDYSYLLQGKPVSRTRLEKMYEKLGLAPNNMLVIMHQQMVGKFVTVSSQDKLRMLEEAVGFQSYRSDVLDARKRLVTAESEEQSLATILESTKETYEYWKKEHEKFQKKRKLEARLDALRKELTWAKTERKQASLTRVDEKITSKRNALESAQGKIEEARQALSKRRRSFEVAIDEFNALASSQCKIAEESATFEADQRWITRIIEIYNEIERKLSQEWGEPERPGRKSSAKSRNPQADETLASLKKERQDLENELKTVTEKAEGRKTKLSTVEKQLLSSKENLNKEMSDLVEANVRVEILRFKKESVTEQLEDLEADKRLAKEELSPLSRQADKVGPRPKTIRKITELEMAITDLEAQIGPIAHISDDVEKMYSSYVGVVEELQGKAKSVAENKEAVLNELSKRFEKWRQVVGGFLGELSQRYSTILSEVDGSGDIQLSDARDIEKAGVELLIGFRGNPPTPLDSLTQSGGERSVALMAFLLALQQHVRSQFRAIDEFDVHLDPKNRETISNLIVSSFQKSDGGQYVAITPGQITVSRDSVHVTVVQNVHGISTVGGLK
ncbi:MAG: AAA family ATPase [archaeon]